MKCANCGYDDHGTGDNAHHCPASPVQGAASITEEGSVATVYVCGVCGCLPCGCFKGAASSASGDSEFLVWLLNDRIDMWSNYVQMVEASKAGPFPIGGTDEDDCRVRIAKAEALLARLTAGAAVAKTDQASDTLHSQIINLPAKVDRAVFANWTRAEQDAYVAGHRDARHAAAELVSEFAAGAARQGGNTNDNSANSRAPIAEGEARMKPLSLGLPSPDEHRRVIVYTDGVDFAGEQYFDIKTEELWELDTEAKPEVAAAATHWMPCPAPKGGDK
jgi:hypothetical protein